MLPFLSKRMPTAFVPFDAEFEPQDDAAPASPAAPGVWYAPGDSREPSAQTPGVRDLCTSDPAPTAPRPQAFFPQDKLVVDHLVTFWDPNGLWPVDALDGVQAPRRSPLGSTRLMQAGQSRPFAVVHHLWFEGSAGQTCVLLHVTAAADDTKAANMALMLMEGSHSAAFLPGGTSDRNMHRRVHEFCRQAAWRGPLMHALLAAGKPGRADRLRRIAWPRSFKVRPLEYNAAASAPVVEALRKLVPALDCDAAAAAPAGLPAAAQAALPQPVAVKDDAAFNLRQVAPFVMPTTLPALEFHPPASLSPDGLVATPQAGDVAVEAAQDALACAHLCFGLVGAGVVDVPQALLVSATGDPDLLREAAATATQLWQNASAHPLDELQWRRGDLSFAAQPVTGRPGLLLLGVAHRDHTDAGQFRWQLKVASNDLAVRAGAPAAPGQVG